MKLVCIFGEGSENALYAVQYPHENLNEFERLFNLWNDFEYLETFCSHYKEDLHGAFRKHITVSQAASDIMLEATMMEKQLYYCYSETQLQELFKPLYNNEYIIRPMQLSKASLMGRVLLNPRIRVYAIRLAPNVFVITGGAIKLTATMHDRPHLMKELEKLKRVKNWLIQNGQDIPEVLNDF